MVFQHAVAMIIFTCVLNFMYVFVCVCVCLYVILCSVSLCVSLWMIMINMVGHCGVSACCSYNIFTCVFMCLCVYVCVCHFVYSVSAWVYIMRVSFIKSTKSICRDWDKSTVTFDEFAR